MTDPRNPKSGGLWARLFGVDNHAAADEQGTPETDADGSDIPLEFDQVPAAAQSAEVQAAAAATPAAAAEALPSALPLASAVTSPVPTPPVTLLPAEPAAPSLTCPACGATAKAGARFCDDCGWLFAAPHAGPMAAAGPSGAPSGGLPAVAFTNPPGRLLGRYEIVSLISERLGVSRFTGFDHGDGTPRPVTIVAQALLPVAEALPEVAESADAEEEFMPEFDNLPAAAPAAAPIAASESATWPGVAWEKQVLTKAGSAALPSVVDYFVENDTEYLVVSRPEGRSLWDAWDDPEASADQRYGWLQQVCEGLQALHGAGAVLEGVRPDLVTVDANGRAVLTDLSDLLPLPLPANPPIRATLYTAPELILDPQSADARSDLYSVGAMLYALEYLHHPLEEKDFERQFTPNQITEKFPDVHPLFLRLINKTFCRDLFTRFPTDEAAKKDPTGFTELIDTIKLCRRTFDKVRFDMAAWTTTGMVRTGNEDALAFLHAVETRQDDLHEYALILLCDGMGGYEAGEVAAALAISEMRKFLLQQPMFAALSGKEPPPEPVDVEATKKVLEACLRHANKEVYTAGRTPGRGKRGMGCTAEAIYIDSRNVVVGHVGDSRTYHLHRGRLQQLTRDQTLVNRLVELGQLTPAEAETHPRKNELQQAIGGQPDVIPGLYSAKLARGDWILVCSDGLTNHVSNKEIETMLTREAAYSAEEAARRLLNLVNLRGATDNATIVVVRAS
ncbi:MAG: protein phosphatase 2C domain-containing protein [Gemmataceae bacterium]|nr:protein phosphatase 2C domain-containing protein [Gemmataceae bacterium]